MLATKAALEVQKLVSIKSEQLTRTFEVLGLGLRTFGFWGFGDFRVWGLRLDNTICLRLMANL